MNGNAVMFDASAGKILTLGGAPSYSHAAATTAAHVLTLGPATGHIAVEEVAPMGYPRAYANSVVLPTGDVFVGGGVSYALQWTDVNSITTPELWSHRTRTFVPLARMPVPRNYHSFALLLPDATVLVGGGGLCWERCLVEGMTQWKPENDHLDVQVFRPPYLFARNGKLAPRPMIRTISKRSLRHGAMVEVAMDVRVDEFAMVRCGSATHSINTDQRRIKLDANPVFPHQEDSKTLRADGIRGSASWTYRVVIPNEAGIAIPGYWMLFAIDHHGIPSVAETLHILTE